MQTSIEALKNEIYQSGITPPDSIEPGGHVNRFSDNGNSKKDGWCVLYDNPDGTAGGVYGNWKDITNTFFYTPEGQQITTEQQSKLNQQIRKAQVKVKQELEKKHKEAAIKAQDIWNDASQADLTHAYLLKKDIEPYGLKQSGNALLVPVLDEHGKIQSLQEILPDGKKKFFPGGKTKYGSFVIGDVNQDTLYICEGYATGATIHKATDKPVVIAFNSGNFKRIAEIYKGKYPSKTFVIASDNDISTEKKTGSNPGLKAAREAVNAINAKISICPVNSDFNDLQKEQGMDAVREALKPQDEIWDDPVIFKTPQLPIMSLEVLPDSIKEIVNAVSKATETPIELAFGLTLSVLGTACQGKFKLEVEPGYFEPVNIWVVAALEPANRKSAVLSKVAKPLTEWKTERGKSQRQRLQMLKQSGIIKKPVSNP